MQAWRCGHCKSEQLQDDVWAAVVTSTGLENQVERSVLEHRRNLEFGVRGFLQHQNPVGCQGYLLFLCLTSTGRAAQVSGSYDTTVRFWNLDSLRCVRKCEGHEDAVRVLAVVNGKARPRRDFYP